MPHLVVAPDKFRGTATASEVAMAVAATGRSRGWMVDEVPLADGGEGTLEAIGGVPHWTLVTGPLGRTVLAQWRSLHDDIPGKRSAGAGGPVAVIEAAQAAGRHLLPNPVGEEPVLASTEGVGQLILAAVASGARRIVVAVGGSATTDGGWGAVATIGSSDRLRGATLVVAYDVRTPFRSAAAIFGPQKGATPAQVRLLERRLDELADRYRSDFGVDVDALVGAGAAGGLAGGLAALGGDLVAGFGLVADFVGLSKRLDAADLVVTGEGRLDRTSFDGKVVGGVVEATGGRAPVLCVVGELVPEAADKGNLPPGTEVISLVEEVGLRRAWDDTANAVADVVSARLDAIPRDRGHA